MDMTGITVTRASQQQTRGESEATLWRLRYRRAVRLAGLVIVLSFAYGVGTSPYFWIREVQVIASDPQLAQQALAQIEMPGEASTLFYPVEKLARAVAECPGIKRAQVGRDLPSRVVVRVWPRVPVAAIKCSEGFALVDEEGVCVRCAPQAPVQLMHVYGLINEPLAPGHKLATDSLHLLTQCLAGLESDQVKSGLIIDFSERYAIRLCTGDGVQGKVGTPDNLQRKVMMFAGILGELQRQGKRPEYIDVRIMDRPVWKPRLGS